MKPKAPLIYMYMGDEFCIVGFVGVLEMVMSGWRGVKRSWPHHFKTKIS